MLYLFFTVSTPTPKLKSEIALDCEISDLYNKPVTLVRTSGLCYKITSLAA
jgi:hypothetical protein